MERTLENAEDALKKIRDYKLHDEAFEQEGIRPEWKEKRFLPPFDILKYARLVIDEYFNDSYGLPEGMGKSKCRI